MTKPRASRPSAKPLNSQHQEFVRLFVAGPHEVRGNQTRAAEKAGFTGPHGRRLMRDPRIKAAIAKFHKAADTRVERRMRDWAELAVDGQEVIDKIQKGKLKGGATSLRVRLDAAEYAIDRALGRPRTSVHHSGSISLEKALDELEDLPGASGS